MQIISHKSNEEAGAVPAGTNQTGMRAYNEKIILTILRRRGALPKAEIAKLTGLSAQTAGVIMRSLEEDGLLVKGKPQRGKVGQPSIPVALNLDGAFFYGLKIGRRSAELIMTNFLGEILEREAKVYSFPTVDAIIDFAVTAEEKLRATLSDKFQERIMGMGIATPFEIWNWAEMIGVDPNKMAHWYERDVTVELAERFTFPIFVGNDASMAASAELTFGNANKLPANFLYIYIGYFVGGGIVLDHKLHTGPHGNAGALAPMHVKNTQGEVVSLLATSSISTLERMLTDANIDTAFLWDTNDEWQVHNEFIEQWLLLNANGLAQAIHTSMAVFDFDAVVIDGWLPSHLRARLTELTKEMFGDLDVAGINEPILMEGSIGKNARALGGASLPLAKRFMVE